MKIYLEYKDEKSHKFWEIEIKANNHTVRYGKIGTDGRETSKEFDSEEEAQKDAQKQINAKKKKGYVEVTSSTLSTPSKPPKEKNEQKPVKIRHINLEQFENKLKDWGFGYPEWAGCRLIQDEAAKVRHSLVYVESDCIMVDERCFEGTFGINHEVSQEVIDVRLTRPKNFNVDYKTKPIQKAVSTKELVKRYLWIADVFGDWGSIETVSVLNYNAWDSIEAVNQSFEEEINHLEDDPHLAMYWLLHMGLCCDERVQRVKQCITQYQLNEKLSDLDDAIAWFDCHDTSYNMKLFGSLKQDLPKNADDFFLIRRASLLENTYLYNYAGGENAFDKWWLCVTLYPKIHKDSLFKVRWLKNNLEKFNKYDLLNNEINYSFSSYIKACNPKEQNKTKFADMFLKELLEHKLLFNDEAIKSFVRVMIWDLKEVYSDKDALKKTMYFYFPQNIEEEKEKTYYHQLCELYFDGQTKLYDIDNYIDELKNITQTLKPNKKTVNQEIIDKSLNYLNTIDDSLIEIIAQKVVKTPENRSAIVYVLLRYIFSKEIDNRVTIYLLIAKFLRKEAMVNYLLTAITNEEDDKVDFILEIIKHHDVVEKSVSYDYIEVLKVAFTYNYYQPKIFPKILNSFNFIENDEDHAYKLFNFLITDWSRIDEDNSLFFPLKKLSLEQTEALLDKIVELIKKFYIPHNTTLFSITNSLSYIKNPEIKKWLENFLRNFEAFQQELGYKDGEYVYFMENIKKEFLSLVKRVKFKKKALLKQLKAKKDNR